MTFESRAAEAEEPEHLSTDDVGDDLYACILDCWRDQIQFDIDWWLDPVGHGFYLNREELCPDGAEYRDCILNTASWAGVPQHTWIEFQNHMRAQPLSKRYNASSLEQWEADVREYYKDDPSVAERTLNSLGFRTIPRDFRHWQAAVQAGDRDCFVWLAREKIVERFGFCGIAPADWYRFRMAAKTWRDPRDAPMAKAHAPSSPAARVAPAPRQAPATDAKLFQKVLGIAFDAASPNRARVPQEAVRPRFFEAYPQGTDTSAKQSANAVRKAWSRAIKNPPAGIVVSDGYISAVAA